MNNNSPIFEPINLGPHRLKNRIVMAPMTRSRATEDGIPTELMVKYYSQRASAGLIITEASQVSLQGTSYPNTPGIYTQEQIVGWKKVTNSVHNVEGKIFIQLFHGGRISHPDTIKGKLPVAPSSIRPKGNIHTYPQNLQKEFVVPRALEKSEIKNIVKQYGEATKNAVDAGFDGIEIHAGNGYLLDQFLRDSTNKRTDEYGGNYQNRVRFLLEVIQEVSKHINIENIGIRLSPLNTFNDLMDSNPLDLYSFLLKELCNFKLAYAHFVEDGLTLKNPEFFNGVSMTLGKYFNGKIIGNGNYNYDRAVSELSDDTIDLVAFGKLFIANPDLPERFLHKTGFNTPDTSTFYVGGKEGYIDYPKLYE